MTTETEQRIVLEIDGWSPSDPAEGPAAYLLGRIEEWSLDPDAEVRMLVPETGEVIEGKPPAIALVLLDRMFPRAGLLESDDYCSECPHCHDGPTSVAVEFGDQGLQVVPAEPCEWCGYDFGMSLVGPDRHECRDEEHLAHGVGCVNCGACLHASHGGV